MLYVNYISIKLKEKTKLFKNNKIIHKIIKFHVDKKADVFKIKKMVRRMLFLKKNNIYSSLFKYGLIEYSCIFISAFAFNLLQVVLVKACEENLLHIDTKLEKQRVL